MADGNVNADQLLNHELYHQAAQRDPRLNDLIRSALAENMTEAELGALVDRYIQAYDGVYDFSKMTAEQIAAICEEELFADLYAGIDNTGRQELRESAQRGFSEAQNMQPQNVEAERDTRGPPEGRADIVVGKGPSALAGDQRTSANILASRIKDIQDMQAVKALSGNELNDRSKSLQEQIENFFDSIGGKVEREGLGTVFLGQYGLGGILNHKPITRAKIMTLSSVPEVIKNGRIINYDPNWKGRGYPSLMIAAPVTIGEKTVYVAAIIDQREGYKFYLNECVDSEGNYLRITEDPTGSTKSGVTAQDGVTRGPEGSSDNSILSSSENSNPQNGGRASVEVGNDPEATVKEMLSRPMSKRDVKGIAYNEDLKKAFTSLTGIELPHYRRAEAEQKIMAYAASHYGMESETETDRKTGSQNRSGAGQSQNQRIRENGTQTLAELRREYKELRRERDRYLRAVRRRRFREKAEQRRRLRKAAGDRQPILRRQRVGRCHGRRTKGADER